MSIFTSPFFSGPARCKLRKFTQYIGQFPTARRPSAHDGISRPTLFVCISPHPARPTDPIRTDRSMKLKGVPS